MVDLFLYGNGRYSNEYDFTNWIIRLSTGNGFETYSFPRKKLNLKDDHVRCGDFNGDGRSDIMVTGPFTLISQVLRLILIEIK